MAALIEPRLVRNGTSGNHLEALQHVIGNATKISIAVAFLKTKGLAKIVHKLQERLTTGAEVEMFIGRNFWITEPRALKNLLSLSQQHTSLNVYVAKIVPGLTFHPKVYLGVEAKEARVIMGSANLTGGALTANEEISLAWTLKLRDPLLEQLQDVFATYRSKAMFEELDAIVIEQYSREFKIAQDAKRRVENELSTHTNTFDLATLSSLHNEFRRDRSEMVALEKRRRDRKDARSVQRQIARLSATRSLSQRDLEKFESLFRDLVTSGNGHRHLWHSGDIHRRGQAALTEPRKTIKLFSLAKMAARLPPVEGYAHMRAPATNINGVGINMVSEMLCTFAPKRYAVFNGNTAAALRAIGADPPKSVTLFSPEAYARVCGVVEAVRRRIDGDDLSDADAFLNWIYQNKVKTAT